ncbi:endonuclease/exonuclease/phosphatase family protein [Candidatus Pacearchaeota archaeon]|nr:endonuclease/exonuclease/phosphatase family protein [Candidatus Pacearchaeota archaeon]
MRFKLMNYNILDGFHDLSKDGNEKNYTYNPSRLEAAAKAVREENPDILVLNEACFSNTVDYRKAFGFPLYFHGEYGQSRGLAVLSRFPIVEAENYASKYCPFIRTKISMNGKTVNLDVAHPHPNLSEQDKRNFVASILRDREPSYILAGDFNAISRRDSYDKELLVRGFSRFDPNAEKKVSDLMQRCVVSEIEHHGLKDTFIFSGEKWKYTIPTDMLSKDKDSAIRIDYIFCSDDFEVVNASVIRNEWTNHASDHYPVTATLDF